MEVVRRPDRQRLAAHAPHASSPRTSASQGRRCGLPGSAAWSRWRTSSRLIGEITTSSTPPRRLRWAASRAAGSPDNGPGDGTPGGRITRPRSRLDLGEPRRRRTPRAHPHQTSSPVLPESTLLVGLLACSLAFAPLPPASALGVGGAEKPCSRWWRRPRRLAHVRRRGRPRAPAVGLRHDERLLCDLRAGALQPRGG